MHKFFKFAVVIWTFICGGMFVNGCSTSFNKLINTNITITESVTAGFLFGNMISLVIWFGIWIIPVIVMMVLSWAFKPGTPNNSITVSTQYVPPPPMIKQPPAKYPYTSAEIKKIFPKNTIEWLILLIVIIIIVELIYIFGR